MMVKAVTFVIVAIVIGAIIYEKFGHKKKRVTARYCSACGRPRIGASPCPCGGKGK
ncbi:hypothetical protein [Gemmobacter serpentinus]|uniref:hypothetical protein n=1 Tax=Gemmobacter serpentinus TaxID=2652247 RepID=UPI001865875C|nr:hypothetical protein [Gemmobacter serpentinus]